MSLHKLNFFISSDTYLFLLVLSSDIVVLHVLVILSIPLLLYWSLLFLSLIETTTLTFFLFINLGSILDADIHHNILSLLKSKAKGHQSPNLISEKLSASLYGHTKAVNAIHWSSTHGKFFLLTNCCPGLCVIYYSF